MSKIKIIDTGKVKLLAIKVPEWYVKSTVYMGYLILTVHNQDSFVSDEQMGNPYSLNKALESKNNVPEFKDVPVKLPEGEFEIIGLSTVLTNEEYGELVLDSEKAVDEGYAYVDYQSNNGFFLSAKESGLSLLEANQITEPVLILKTVPLK